MLQFLLPKQMTVKVESVFLQVLLELEYKAVLVHKLDQ